MTLTSPRYFDLVLTPKVNKLAPSTFGVESAFRLVKDVDVVARIPLFVSDLRSSSVNRAIP